ncbi:MAG: glycosyltransferase family 9 protein [Halobacteriovoraceae bacterium]|nr:glycosyltransferase family 9 protein [Halobacteriovoraceae bacterium]MCB9095815.1 glycosyltransferase family 9 protein [Halobacteriovoraceae bacterium]
MLAVASMKNKFLIIQTAFIGDVILATSLVEQLYLIDPEAEIHFFLRKGNESLLQHNPHIKKIWVWDKKNNKHWNLFKLLLDLRKEKFSTAINIQRFFSTGLLLTLCGAKVKIGFDKNPWSRFFTHRIVHHIPDRENGQYLHEVERNAKLLAPLVGDKKIQKLRPSLHFPDITETENKENYVVLAPASVWYTKQWPKEYWAELVKMLGKKNLQVYLIGSPEDKKYCDEIIEESHNTYAQNLCGRATLMQSALLMRNALRVFVNDSAPLHLASAMNAPTTAIFCSTIKDFGYGPLSDRSITLEVKGLDCRPCGLHGKKACPLGHFRCGYEITPKEVLKTLDT